MALLLGMMLCQSAGADIRGANFLQSSRVAWDGEASDESLRRLRFTGANWIALVPFLSQSDSASCDVRLAPHYDLESLRSLIRRAKALDFKVALKPQMLVHGSWAGDIAARDEAGWECWFSAYGQALLSMARIARDEHVDMFVAGTELKRTESRLEWRALIAGLRNVYRGPVTWVFHAPDDAKRFTALRMLHSVGLALYPRMGRSAAEVYRATAWQRVKLKALARSLPKPIWIAEIGIPSRVGAGDAPWLWNERISEGSEPDPQFQAEALYAWLDALRGNWHQGVMVWNWMSDPDAGGMLDTDFTPQNKPAERVLRCVWRDIDMTECAP